MTVAVEVEAAVAIVVVVLEVAVGPNRIGSDKPAKSVASRSPKSTSWAPQHYTRRKAADSGVTIPIPTVEQLEGWASYWADVKLHNITPYLEF